MTLGRQSRTCIMVLGVHRSGTSALTRVINLAGADLGSEMIDAGDDNPHGFWEHRNACALHETLLTELGSSWHDVRALPVGWQDSVFAEKARTSIRQLIMDEFSEKTLWAIKDPRMCRLVSLWIDVLEELGIRPVAVLALRHPKEVAASIHKRNGLTKQHAYLMWAQHEIEAFTSVTNLPHVKVYYNELLDSPFKVLEKISAGLEVRWPIPVDEAARSIRDFLLHDEKHHHVSHFRDDIERSAGWAINKLYNVFSAHDSQMVLPALYENYNYLTPLYSEEIDSLTVELQKCNEEVYEHSQVNDGLQSELSSLKADRDAIVANHDAMKCQRAELEQRVKELEQRAQEFEQRAQEFEQRAQEFEQRAQGFEQRTQEFERERDGLNVQLAAMRCELDDSSRHLDDTRAELDQLKAASQRIGWLVKKVWLKIIGD